MTNGNEKQNERSRRGLSRRTSLSLLGTALTTGLAGCTGGGGGGGGSSGSSGSGSATSQSSSPTGTPEGSKQKIQNKFDLELVDYADQVEDKLTIFQWNAYWPTYFVPNFEQLYDVDVSVSIFASNEGMFNKLKALGPGQVDIIFPSDFMVNIMATQGMLQPLTLDKIPTYENLKPKFLEVPYEPKDMSGTFSNPYNWGWSAMGNNKKVTGRSLEPTWDELWNEEHKGNISMLNNVRETIGAALIKLGYSMNTTDEQKIDEAKQALLEQKEKGLIQSYDSTNVQSVLTNGEASPAHGWPSQVYGAYRNLMDDNKNAPVEFVIPKEGNVIWTDAAVLDKKAPHPNAAHAFINYMNNVKVHADLTDWLIYPPIMTNERQYRKQEWVFEKLDGFSPTEEQLGRMEYLQNVGQATKLYSEAWTEVTNA